MMATPAKTTDGRLVVFSGKSRSGKTALAMQKARDFERVIVWDVQGQWAGIKGYTLVRTRKELLQAVQSKKVQKIAFFTLETDIKAEFDYWCAAAHHFGQFNGGALAVAEELADVTTPAKAPGEWGILVRRTLKHNITIFAISQRWAEADKTALGNSSEIYCFQLPRKKDRF
jgi:hypothetical protein